MRVSSVIQTGRESSPRGKATSASEERGSEVIMGSSAKQLFYYKADGDGVGPKTEGFPLGRRERALVLLDSYCPAV